MCRFKRGIILKNKVVVAPGEMWGSSQVGEMVAHQNKSEE